MTESNETSNATLSIQRRTWGDGFDWLPKAWPTVQKHYGILLGAMLIAFVLQMVAQVIPIIGPILAFVVSAIVYPGYLHISMKALHDEKTDIPDLFDVWENKKDRLLHLILVQLVPIVLLLIMVVLPLVFVAMLVGFENLSNVLHFTEQGGIETTANTENLYVMLAATGIALLIYLTVMLPATLYTMPLIYFENLNVIEAVSMSFVASWKNISPLTSVSLIIIGISILGVLCLFVGLVLALPLIWMMYLISYMEIFRIPSGYPTQTQATSM